MTDDDISDLEIALHGRAVQKPGRTPGPWFATYAQPGIWHINSGPRYGCGDIATVWGGPNDTPEADARLIAAAPEMYEVLRALYVAVRDDALDPQRAIKLMPEMESARAALAKATGSNGNE